jgi:GTP-binding protein Era
MKAGYVAIIGEPNVGKSTLLNRLVGTKLSIVGSKPQITRNRILGILTDGNCQCYFLDTPGIIDPAYKLQELMVDAIARAVGDADVIIWMIDPWFRESACPHKFLTGKPLISVINKIDLVPKTQLLPIIDIIKNKDIRDIVPISALTGEGIEELKKVLFTYLPEGPFLYPEEDLSDSPERFFVAELIREKIFELFQKEIPYSTCVVIDEFKERKKSKDFIRATIYVERKSQKGILIGKDGEALKEVGALARKEIENFLGRHVFLELWVKVKEKWRKDKKFLREIGY